MSTSSEQIDVLLRTIVSVALKRADEYDRLDGGAADGDFGSTLARGAGALAADAPSGSAAEQLRGASKIVTDAMGGSSGPLCGIALLRAGEALGDEDPDHIDGPTAASLVRAAIEGMQDIGDAERGDKTALDALFPVGEALAEGGDAAAAAREGADSTTDIEARRGRAAYAGERSKGAVDPGAIAVAEVCETLRDGDPPPSWDELAAGPAVSADDEAEGPRKQGFVGDPAAFVNEALDGFVRAHADLVERLEGLDVIVRAGRDTGSGRVAVVSGGGAGHEPLHAGFVGEGMLDAACPGAVFTSPSPSQIQAATEAVHAGAGVLHIVKSYTGDILNFRMAAEFAAADAGVEVATVVVDDDVAIAADSDTERRGTGVTIVAEKVAGALAAEGAALADVAAGARRAVDRGRSFGIALHGEEMEVGVGIHGEPGQRRSSLESADAIATALVDPVLAEIAADAPLLVLLSGLGGTPPLELSVLFEHIGRLLDGRGRHIERAMVGDFITSLDQPGAVLSIVALDDELTRLWDAPARTVALTR